MHLLVCELFSFIACCELIFYPLCLFIVTMFRDLCIIPIHTIIIPTQVYLNCLYKLTSVHFFAVVGTIIVCIVITLFSVIIIVDFHLNNYVIIYKDKIYYNSFFLKN